MSEARTDSVFVKVPCYLTGRLVLDTDRERIRQRLARFLVEERGFGIAELMPDRQIRAEVEGQKIVVIVDLVVRIDGRSMMILRGAPGSVVSRESGTIAAARLLEPGYVVPWAVQANLVDATLLDVCRKRAAGWGWEAIPSRSQLLSMTTQWPPPSLPGERIRVERQILYAYETHWRKDRPQVAGDEWVCL